ncbi:lysosome-associated membrane glycoprotein 1 precursor [Silurus asotus]|uniref:Lysosome-associated membrane glycoprotein 1 n=1 Tax=Silurus asotus TaxID=30991 RepID=A0AAD5B6F8_SILAS|nr:lysosome-associated membrane glycoprotein 1 precursor [Silurus asotus]
MKFAKGNERGNILALCVAGWLSAAHGVILEVKNGNSTCIKADISANFTITYPVKNGTKTVVVPLPESATVGNGSSCGGEGASPDLLASFGNGHSLGLLFSSTGRIYRVANLSLTYNLTDNTTFPESSSKEVMVLTTNNSQISAQLNTTYRCMSSSVVNLGGPGVTVTFFNIRMQAYMPSANLSTNETICSADVPSTTVAPTTTPISPTTPVTPTIPERGNYSVLNSNGTTCLLARMGLQLNVTYFSKSQNKTVVAVMNIQPNRTSFSGSCESTTTTLLLTGDLANLTFVFTLNTTTSKYQLSTVNMSAFWEDMTAQFQVSNSSLQYMQGTLGRSYMCSVEEVLPVGTNFSLNTFELQVQPFDVRNNEFGPADVCRMQKDNMLVPIIVGACLAGLVLIVLIAYLIGRKRSHAGYQTI